MGKLKDAAATLDRAWKLAEIPQGAMFDSSAIRTLAWIENDRANVAN